MHTEQVLEKGTYEIIQSRLQEQKQELINRLEQLKSARNQVFGSVESKLKGTERINTPNACIARDIIALGNHCLFGYNVHFGLRTDIQLADVFSQFEYKDDSFQESPLQLINDKEFEKDFKNLYKYYRNTFFAKFTKQDNYLYMIFQVSESSSDIKCFKWLIRENQLQYVDNRSEHEIKMPSQQEFQWQESSYEMHRYGQHPHVSILDKVFVETVGGDLTIKIEDNTDDGKGIYNEAVEFKDQTLEDGTIRFADLGNIIILSIQPYQEEPRYFVYNHKIKTVERIQSIQDAAILLPDKQGLIFPDGYYLQTGSFKKFERKIEDLRYQGRIDSPNGEDFIYIFYEENIGDYVLMPYNIIRQQTSTPIVCSGFTLFPNGEMAYFKLDAEATKHHQMQIWSTPFSRELQSDQKETDSLLYKIGNKSIVRAMAECQEIITLLNKEDDYENLYDDIKKQSTDILDSYYWISDEETYAVSVPLQQLREISDLAIDEFERVKLLRKAAADAMAGFSKEVKEVFNTVGQSRFEHINEFVEVLETLRNLQGKSTLLKEQKYINTESLTALEEELENKNAQLSRRCVDFLLEEKALQPYKDQLKELEEKGKKHSKSIELKEDLDALDQLSGEMEMLIDIVNSLMIEDNSQSTMIVERISVIFSIINKQRASFKQTLKQILKKENEADFHAQMKLFSQSITNVLDLATDTAKCDAYLNKLSVQLEELEAKFAQFEDFSDLIIEKRDSVFEAFDLKKSQLKEAHSKEVVRMEKSADRLINAIRKKADSFKQEEALHAYFASDLMVSKLRKTIEELKEVDESAKAENFETLLKSAKEETLSRLKDKNELYEDGDQLIKFGEHRFAVNKQALELSIIAKEGRLYSHLTGTAFEERIDQPSLSEHTYLWEQSIPSENKNVYRSEHLSYKAIKEFKSKGLTAFEYTELDKIIQKIAAEDFESAYVKGVHDEDAKLIGKKLLQMESELGILKYDPVSRSIAQLFWVNQEEQSQKRLLQHLRSSAAIKRLFPNNQAKQSITLVKKELVNFMDSLGIESEDTDTIVAYLEEELMDNNKFHISQQAYELYSSFSEQMKQQKMLEKLKLDIKELESINEQFDFCKEWITAFAMNFGLEDQYIKEACILFLYPGSNMKSRVINANSKAVISNMAGGHSCIQEGKYQVNYHEFFTRLSHFESVEQVRFKRFNQEKKSFLEAERERMGLEQYQANVLSSFVRNKLIDQVYLPLIGDNLAKQLGTAGKNKRTDRMGMLLLISPPGYGKTTLMEYIADRMGLVFMKINGPSIGHEVQSLDPASADNAACRQELEKLNLALEMGDNVMLYLDDIQHCNPAFLQKFISLADGQRKIEGVYKGKSKTYNFKDRKFCVIMAGNPYTESGDKFQIPDMLANRADIYNLGDVIGGNAALFKLSLLENALSSNSTLKGIANRNSKDIYTLINYIEQGKNTELVLEGNHNEQEIRDAIALLERALQVRNAVLKVNETYIQSAAMEDAYRTEPAFKLQGSYRDMNKLMSKIVPMMNEEELHQLLLSHYENESQTLGSNAEANILKYKELQGILNPIEWERWHDIKERFMKDNKLNGLADKGEMALIIQQMIDFTDKLDAIRKVLSEK